MLAVARGRRLVLLLLGMLLVVSWQAAAVAPNSAVDPVPPEEDAAPTEQPEPLMVTWAREGNNSELLKLIILGEGGIPGEVQRVNVQGHGGYTPLMAAVAAGHHRTVAMLLQYGANPGLEDDEGMNPIHQAGWLGRSRIMEEFCNFGLNLRRAQMDDGLTPLHRACFGSEPEHAETVRVIVEDCKVNVDETTRAGRVCYDITPNELTKQYIVKVRAEKAAAAAKKAAREAKAKEGKHGVPSGNHVHSKAEDL